MGELLPSKANLTEAQTMEYFQWDNERPGLVQETNDNAVNVTHNYDDMNAN